MGVRALLGLATLATYRTVRAEKAQESHLLRDAYRIDAASPVWVYFGAQPTMRLIPHPDLRFIGMLDARSGAQRVGLDVETCSPADSLGDT